MDVGYPTTTNDSKGPLHGIHPRKLSKDPSQQPNPIENVHFLTLEGWHD